MTKARHLPTLVLAVMLIAAACSGGGEGSPFGGSDTTGAPATTSGGSTSGGATTTGGGSSGDGTTDTTSGTTGGAGSTDTTAAAAAGGGQARPLPIMEGLATFDSFEWTMRVITIGPTADEFMDISTTLIADRETDRRRTTLASTQDGPDFDGPETSAQETWQDATGSCTYDGSDYTFESITPQQREILDVALGLFDIQAIPETGTEIGQEDIAGIPATHYRYTISGLGADSGALVTDNQVDYWMSNDTGVLLKYSLIAETRSGPTTDPTAEVYRVEAAAELQAANAPVDVAFPAECEALRPADTGGSNQASATGSRIVLRIGGESAGVLSAEPVCTVTGGAGNQEISALVDGRVNGTRYRVTVIAPGVAGDGEVNASFEMITGAGDNRTDASGEAPVTVTFLEGGLVSLDFSALLDDAAERTRLVGTVTCPAG